MTEPEHIPAPADHAPRKESVIRNGKLCVREPENEEAWISTNHHVPVER